MFTTKCNNLFYFTANKIGLINIYESCMLKWDGTVHFLIHYQMTVTVFSI